MAQPYVGEIRMFAGTFAPLGWEFCDGQLMPISENEVLFQLIGTTYGGDGESNFALPDLRGRVPIHQVNVEGNRFPLAQASGVEQVTLTVNQIAAHSHPLLATVADGTGANPQGSMPAQAPAGIGIYFEDSPTTNMASAALGPVGGSQPHTNFQPYLCVNFIISMFGIFPSPT